MLFSTVSYPLARMLTMHIFTIQNTDVMLYKDKYCKIKKSLLTSPNGMYLPFFVQKETLPLHVNIQRKCYDGKSYN